MKPNATVGAGSLIIEENKVLLVKPNYGKAKGAWILPGGFVDSGETLEQGLLRELEEETGQLGRVIKPLCVRYRRDPMDIYWVFRVNREGANEISLQAEELMDVQFLDVDFALQSEDVRPMTRYFIALSQTKNPKSVVLPKEFSDNNWVYVFGD